MVSEGNRAMAEFWAILCGQYACGTLAYYASLPLAHRLRIRLRTHKSEENIHVSSMPPLRKRSLVGHYRRFFAFICKIHQRGV